MLILLLDRLNVVLIMVEKFEPKNRISIHRLEWSGSLVEYSSEKVALGKLAAVYRWLIGIYLNQGLQLEGEKEQLDKCWNSGNEEILEIAF